jgi:heme exporter protein C
MKIKSLYLFLILATAVALEIALYLALQVAPTEATMGDVQRIFYFHVPSAWAAFAAFFVVFLASIAYLRSGRKKWDLLARAAAEIGIVFMTMVLLTGPLWAKAAWHAYWTWDARLTTSVILWLIYAAYLMIRQYSLSQERGSRFAAVFGIIGFIDVPIVYMSIRWWRTLHPGPVIGGGAGSGLAPEMLLALMTALAAFTLLLATCLVLYYNILKMQYKLEEISEANS